MLKMKETDTCPACGKEYRGVDFSQFTPGEYTMTCSCGNKLAVTIEREIKLLSQEASLSQSQEASLSQSQEASQPQPSELVTVLCVLNELPAQFKNIGNPFLSQANTNPFLSPSFGKVHAYVPTPPMQINEQRMVINCDRLDIFQIAEQDGHVLGDDGTIRLYFRRVTPVWEIWCDGLLNDLYPDLFTLTKEQIQKVIRHPSNKDLYSLAAMLRWWIKHGIAGRALSSIYDIATQSFRLPGSICKSLNLRPGDRLYLEDMPLSRFKNVPLKKRTPLYLLNQLQFNRGWSHPGYRCRRCYKKQDPQVWTNPLVTGEQEDHATHPPEQQIVCLQCSPVSDVMDTSPATVPTEDKKEQD